MHPALTLILILAVLGCAVASALALHMARKEREHQRRLAAFGDLMLAEMRRQAQATAPGGRHLRAV